MVRKITLAGGKSTKLGLVKRPDFDSSGHEEVFRSRERGFCREILATAAGGAVARSYLENVEYPFRASS